MPLGESGGSRAGGRIPTGKFRWLWGSAPLSPPLGRLSTLGQTDSLLGSAGPEAGLYLRAKAGACRRTIGIPKNLS
jgi:hypothetical protein